MLLRLKTTFVAYCCKKCTSIWRSGTLVCTYRMHVTLGCSMGKEDVGSAVHALTNQRTRRKAEVDIATWRTRCSLKVRNPPEFDLGLCSGYAE